MNRKNEIVFISLVLVFACSQLMAKGGKVLLPDGFVLDGVNGQLVPAKKTGDKWFFQLDSPITVGESRLAAGRRIELLRSSALEKLQSVAKSGQTSYRIWGKVTKYRGKNFIYPIYFLGLSEATDSDSRQESKSKPSVNEVDDELALPERIVSRLNRRKIIRPQQIEKTIELKEDSILASRSAILVERADGAVELVFDGLGRKAGKIAFELLACQDLEKAQREQVKEVKRLRFEISGILTQYKGSKYVLLQRATRLYSHGNF